MDESGNLGFKEKATNYFVIGYITCSPSVAIRTELKHLLKYLHKKRLYHRVHNELKFSKMNDTCRRVVLKKLVELDANIGVIVVDKKQVLSHLRDNPPRLYNWLLAHHIISALLPALENGQKIRIFLDKSLPKDEIEEFNTYVKEKADYLFYEKRCNILTNRIECQHVDSKLEPCIQAADAVAGAYFHEYEQKNSDYADIINDVASFIYLWKK